MEQDFTGAALFASIDRMRATFKRTGSAAAAHAAELARYDDADDDETESNTEQEQGQ